MINLDQLRDLLGDENLLLKYINMFKVSGPENLLQIQEAFENKDPNAFMIATHSLKTQFAYFANKEAHEITLFLENISPELIHHNDITIANAIHSLKEQMDATISKLNQYQSI